MRRYGSASACTPGFGIDEIKNIGEAKYPIGAITASGNKNRRNKRLINRPIDFINFARARKTRDKNAHSRKDRRNKHDHDEKNLPTHADRRIAFKTDDISDDDVINQSLQTAENIRQHRRRGDFPNRTTERTFDDRTIIFGFKGFSGVRWISSFLFALSGKAIWFFDSFLD